MCFLVRCCPARPTLFPYTTLFRSAARRGRHTAVLRAGGSHERVHKAGRAAGAAARLGQRALAAARDRKSTRLNSSHVKISYAGFCLRKKTHEQSDGRAVNLFLESV